ncbi:VOC family protein [Pannus brasiliensis CCIBt3594]|uniref:VOC family protein n=1 Tax=Pannus brasiliensis CCIBt3594 TaxID=1427578 RepID=A0AAW9QRB8_9CHRO
MQQRFAPARCAHTAILVADLDRSVYFYETVLGLTRIDRSLKYSGVWYQIGDHQIHLIVDPDFQSTRYNGEKWGRNPHFALIVEDIEQARVYLEERGYPVQMSASGRPALFVSDPDGNIIEMSQG